MDLYQLLGLPRGATLIEIKRSYRRLARKFHPDINPGDNAAEARFKEITRAYETLSDPDRRLSYDAAGGVTETTTVAFGFEGFDFSTGGASAASTFGDLFAEVFTQRQETRQTAGPEAGADLHASISLTFDEAIHGAQRQLTLARRETCHTCRGTGVLTVAESRCRACQGSGVIRTRRGSMVFSKSCEGCGGTGIQTQMACNTCGGIGTENLSDMITVRMPAGIADGARVRIPDKGNAGVRGGRTGDLYIAVHVEPHDLFRRDADDLHTVVPIAIHEAALGAKIDVPAPDGQARLRVPPGTQTGQRFRLHGRGAPSPRGGGRGDLVVEVRIMLPKVLDERSKELLREFGRINGEDVR
ncbi:MAG: J domain-containing protein [Vicinamibacterales bacterium]|nr:J domain-containing protein [Vicinamibacterales bacterium]